MAVKYDKVRDRFEVRHYEDLSNEEIIEGVNNIDINDKKLITLGDKLKKIEFESRKIKAEIEDLENYQDVIGRVTHIFNGVPVMISNSMPDDFAPIGRYTFSGIGSYKTRKYLEAWTNAHLNDDVILNTEDTWCFKLVHGNDHEETFLARKYKNIPSSNGFHLDFVKSIAYEFVVNNKSLSDFRGENLNKWIEIFKRDSSLKYLLDS